MMYWVDGHGWMMGWAWIPMLLFWVLAIVGGLLLFRRQSGSNAGHRTPLDILKIRYAKGEIDREEYEQKRRDLES